MNHMKKIRYYLITTLILLSLVFIVGCMDADINRNKYEVNDDEIDRQNYALGSTIKGLQGLVIPTQEHLYQFVEAMCGGAYAGYFGETRTGWLEKYSTYNPKVDWLKAPFTDVLSETYPKYYQILNRDSSIGLALAKILRVTIMHRVTDIYGPIPYSSLSTSDGAMPSEGLNSPYDSQQRVYQQMFKELDEADAVLAEFQTKGKSGFEKLDDVYFGNLHQWRLFLHSLQLRMAMRLCYTDMAGEAQKIAEKAVASGVIEKNEDNALLHVLENRSALCFNDWSDYRAGADLICYMNGYKDPRRAKYFTTVKLLEKDVYVGMRIGINYTGSDDNLIKGHSNRLITATDPYVWLTASEVSFLRAEGALRKWNMGGDAQNFYETGVRLSFEENGVKGVDEYLKSLSLPESYQALVAGSPANSPSNITVKWNESGESAFEENLERIITQKWIAIYPNGIEAWSEHRRTHYPKLFPVEVNKGKNVSTEAGMRRLMYPAEEYTQNATHIESAIQLLIQESSNNKGGDTGGTHVWWDKKPNL